MRNAFLTLMLSVAAISCGSRANSIEIGVNRPNLFKYNVVEGDEEQTLRNQCDKIDQIYSSGCREMRLTITDFKYVDRLTRHIRYANSKGMRVTVNFLGVNVYPDSVKRMPPMGPPRRWGGWPAHQMDLDKARREFGHAISTWHDAGCRIQAIEVGNEQGWCEFNGDLPVLPKGEGMCYDSTYTWDTLPEGVPEGIRKLAEVTKIVRMQVDSLWNGSRDRPQVLVGGLNRHVEMDWCRSVGGTFLLPELVLMIYKGTFPGQKEREDLLEYADGVGIHMYPHPAYDASYDDKVAYIKDYIHTMMDPIMKVTRLPMYVTEVGFRSKGPEHEKERLELFKAMMQAFEETCSLYDWRLVQIYSWDASENHTFIDEEGNQLESAAIFAR